MPGSALITQPAESGSVCFVTDDLGTVCQDGGGGTHVWLTAHLLAARGWRVHLLYHGPAGPDALTAVRQTLAPAGIGLTSLDEVAFPNRLLIFNPTGDTGGTLRQSGLVRHALEELHRVHGFDLIEFQSRRGLGLRAIQAKRAGLVFGDVTLVVKLHYTGPWLKEGNKTWGIPSDLFVDFAERWAFENADVQAGVAAHLLDAVRTSGWAVRDDARVTRVYPPREVPVAHERPGPIREVVFVGRLETRKGLDLFLDAIEGLTEPVSVTFLGSEGYRGDGPPAAELIRTRMKDRPSTILSGLDRRQTLAYLAGGDRLAVIASRAEAFGYAAAECAAHGIPFIACRVGGIPEIVTDPEARRQWLCEPSPAELRRCLTENLQPSEANAALRRQIAEQLHPDEHNAVVAADYADWLRRGRDAADKESVPCPVAGTPLVTVGVTYYNLGDFLPDALASLAAQTYPHIEVVVVDDGSTCPRSQLVFAEQQRLYPRFRFVRQANAGPGAARNRVLREAKGEFFIPVDADNIARQDMVERFVRAVLRNPGLSAMTCYFLAFRDTADIGRDDFLFQFCPVGGPHVAACVHNVYGDTNAVFRADDLRAVGGFETDRSTFCEDLETYIKLVNSGRRVGVIPEALYYYRKRSDGRCMVMTRQWTDVYPFIQRVIKSFYYPAGDLPRAEKVALWQALAGYLSTHEAHLYALSVERDNNGRLHRELGAARREVGATQLEVERLQQALLAKPLRYRLADAANDLASALPWVHSLGKHLTRSALRVLRRRPPADAPPDGPGEPAHAPLAETGAGTL